MADIRPLLVLDSSAVLAGRPPIWQEWARFGLCALPQAVFEEMEFLTKRASDPQQEAVARELLRVWPEGHFQVTDASALVVGASGSASQSSKRVRLEQAIADCAYALGNQQVGTLVVVVSEHRTLVNRIQSLQVKNLCAVSVAELGLWIRQQKRPNAVEQAIQHMPGPPIPASSVKAVPGGGLPPAVTQPPSNPASPRRSLTAVTPPPPPKSKGNGILQSLKLGVNLFLLMVSLGLLAGSGLVVWRLLDPEASQPTWERFKLPELPGTQPEP